MRVIQTIQGWQVEEHESYSDHKRITFDLPGFKMPQFEAKWIVDKADWPRFRSIMTKAFDQWRRPVYWTPYMVDKEADDLNRDVNKALHLTCKRTSGRACSRQQPYFWTESIAFLHKAAKRARRTAMRF